MKEAVIHADDDGTKVTLREVEIPKPAPDEVLIRVVAFGTNPKDWKRAKSSGPHNSGDDIAGVVEAVGDDAFEFSKGDRVAAFHVMLAPSGAFAEYAIAPTNTVFRIPPTTSFEEAATIPLAALTAAFAVFRDLDLPMPWAAPEDKVRTPLIIYGASTAVGAFAIKLAHKAQIHPVIAVGSSTSHFIQEYLDFSKGDKFVDYTASKDEDSLADAIKSAVLSTGDQRQACAFDSVGSAEHILAKVLLGCADVGSGRKPRLGEILPAKDFSGVDPGVEVVITYVGHAHAQGDYREGDDLFAASWMALFSRGLKEGWLKPHPYEVMPRGLNGLDSALEALRTGKVRGKKMVGRVADTPGLS